MLLFFALWINIFSVFNSQLSIVNTQLTTLSPSGLSAHPQLVSITTMDIDSQNKNIKLYIRICIEELEIILHHKYNIDGWIGTSAEHRDSRKLLEEYVNERFTISVNNDEKMLLTTDSIAIDDVMMCFYMRGAAKQTIIQIEVNNRLLTDFFEKQMNLVLIGIAGRTDQGYVLNRQNSTIMLSL